MKISPLDAKKKKTIQNIRTILNDHPDLHPLAHNVLLSATYTVLQRLHKDMLEIDGYGHKYTPDEKVAGYAKAIQTAKSFTSKRSVSVSETSLTNDINSPEYSKNKRNKEELEEKNEKQRTEREAKKRRDNDRQRELDRDIVEMMGFERDII